MEETQTNGHAAAEEQMINGHGLANDHAVNGDTNGLTNGHTNGETNGLSNGHVNGTTTTTTTPPPPINGLTNGHTNGTNGVTSETNGHVVVEEKSPELMPIAIIGMSCRLSGDVFTPDDLWAMVSRSRTGWCEIPENRFSKDAYYHPNPAKKGAVNTKAGYFLSQDPALFDAPFFNITQAEAEAMDPQQRMLLETTYEAIENAGIPKEKLVGQKIGVFVGGTASDYRLGTLRDLDQTPMFDATGNHQSIQSGRISHYFDLRGPSFTVDTACSSSIIALHQAVQSIRAGESEQAIVAACHLNLQPGDWVSMSLSRLFSDQGMTYAFDSRAKSGFARGEGAGALILKPLEQALKDNDKIRSVIVNTGINQDGRTVGITSPSGEAQETLMREVYASAGIKPEDVGFVEAHGTGTKVGDPIEATAIHNVFGKGRTARHPLYIGSVKSNVGHLENASGVISVIKSSLMLEKGFILPNANYAKPNPSIPLQQWNMRVPTSQRPWPANKKYLSINNFGFGGANAHCVLERPPPHGKAGQPRPKTDGHQRLFVVSANDEVSARKKIEQLTIFLEQHPEVFQKGLLRNLVYTLCHRRSQLAWRVGLVASSANELGELLTASDVKPVRAPQQPRIAFVYTGQGAQWHAMGRELMDSYPVFAETVRAADACLKGLGADFSLIEELFRDKKTSRVGEAHISQPICSAVQLGLTALLKSWGVTPSSVTGHSSGEIGAAYAAGALSLEAAMAVAYYRGQAIIKMKELHPDLKGSMMAVGAGPEEVLPLAKTLKNGTVVVACENSPSSVTASGDEAAIDELAELIEAKQFFNRKLRVDVAYHSPHMKLIAEHYNEAIKDTLPAPESEVGFFSSLHGKKVETSVLDASYWVDNLTCPVRFSTSLKLLCETSPPDVIVEVGPHAALEGPVKQILKAMGQQTSKITYFSALKRNENATTTALNLAANLFMKGQPLDYSTINLEEEGVEPPMLITDMKTYPWSHQRYWAESRTSAQHRRKPFPRHDLLGNLADFSNELAPTWRNVLRTDDLPWLRHHKMQSLTTFPFSGFASMAIEAAAQRATLRGVEFERFVMREIQVKRPLLMEDGVDYEVVLSMAPYAEGTRAYSDDWDDFRIWSWEQGKGWTEHCRGLVAARKGDERNVISDAHRGIAGRRYRSALQVCQEDVSHETMYAQLDADGANYGPTFQRLSDIKACADKSVAVVTVADTTETMPEHYQTPYHIHPALLDQVFQLCFPILGAGRSGMSTLYMPSQIRELRLRRSTPSVPGEKLYVTGRGTPDFVTPRATDFDMDALLAPGDDQAVVSLVGLCMTPVKSEGSVSDAPRELCFKLTWELVDKPQEIEAEEVKHAEEDKAEKTDAAAEIPVEVVEVVGIQTNGIPEPEAVVAEKVNGVVNGSVEPESAPAPVEEKLPEMPVVEKVNGTDGSIETPVEPIVEKTAEVSEIKETNDINGTVETETPVEKPEEIIPSSEPETPAVEANGISGVVVETPVEETTVEKPNGVNGVNGSNGSETPAVEANGINGVVVATPVEETPIEQPNGITEAEAVNGVNGHVESEAAAAVPTTPWSKEDVLIISNKLESDSFMTSLTSALASRTGQTPTISTLQNASASESTRVILCELGEPILSTLDAEGFAQVQKLMTTSAGVLWVTKGAYLNATTPTGSMALGLTRTVRSETAAAVATMDLDPESALEDDGKVELVLKAFEKIFFDDEAIDMEFSEKDGVLVVPRIVNDDEMNLFVHRELQASSPYAQDFAEDGRRLKMTIGTTGALDTIYWVDEQEYVLGPDEIEIEVKATGMNFKDVVIAMGQLPNPYMGIECAGVVSRIGANVTSLAVGDRVASMSEGAYSTFTRCPATSAARIPEDMSFEIAASIPVVYCTAYYGLIELGRLSEGEKVLIHAAAGGVGQASMQLAKMTGAEIYATVGSTDKKKSIMEEYGIPEDHIFSSRDTTFGPAIREATNGKGVDVIINSLAGDFLRETWDCIAHFGRFIEIGKRDITGNTRLEMAHFNYNASFSSVDLTVMAQEKPRHMARIFDDVMKLFQKKAVNPIAPITVYGISEVEKAFRLLQSGKTTGKLIVTPRPGEQVRAVHKKMGALLRPDVTYLIIGGTGGLGRSMSRWMVEKGARTIVLLSRSGRMEGEVAKLAEEVKMSAGASIVVKACDVVDMESVTKVVEECAKELPPIAGVVHSAMVLRDMLFEKMTFEDWEAVVRSKVSGAWNIHQALLLPHHPPLDFFVAISSAAGIVGNRGQAAYAAANTYLDALAQHRRRLGLKAASLALTAVADVGYLADNAARQDEVMKNLGGDSICEAEELALLAAAILPSGAASCDAHCLTGLRIGGEDVGPDQLPYFAADAKFAHLRDAALALSASAGGAAAQANVSIGTQVSRAQTPEEARGIVTVGLAGKLGAILMVPSEDLDPETPITKYGLDSLNAIELRNWITKELGANLQVLELLTSGSLTNLAGTVLKKRAASEKK